MNKLLRSASTLGLALGALALAALPGCAAPTDDPIDDGEASSDSEAQALVAGPEWSIVTLVFRAMDADFVDAQGVRRHRTATMPAALVQHAHDGAAQMKTNFLAWNHGRASAKMTVIDVDDPIRHLSYASGDHGVGYWVSPADVAAALDKYAPRGKFDSVMVVWDAGSGASAVPGQWYAWGRGPGDDTNGMTYAAVHPDTGGEGMVHEWLHGAGAFYRSHDLDVPDPHENRVFGYPASAPSGTWSAWYINLMRGSLLRSGHVAGYTSAVWRSGTPRKWIGGTYPAAAAPALATPTLRTAYDGNDQWVYAEWTVVPRTTSYSVFLTIKKPDGSNGAEVYHYGQPGIDRGAFDYWYFSRAEICAAARKSGVPLASVKSWVQVWSDKSAARDSIDVSGAIDCR